jgi:hypothetical protein
MVLAGVNNMTIAFIGLWGHKYRVIQLFAI